jgi:hypothetical protein
MATNEKTHLSPFEQAKAEYLDAENAYCAKELKAFSLTTAARHFLVNSERAPADLDGKSAMPNFAFDANDTFELTDYLFTHLTDAKGQTLQAKFLAEVAPSLSETTRLMARRRAEGHPELWQIVNPNSDHGVLAENLFDHRTGYIPRSGGDEGIVLPHGLLFGELVPMFEDQLWPVGSLYSSQPGDRQWLLQAIGRSHAQAVAGGLVETLEEFLTVYEGAIRGAIRVANGLRPPASPPSYIPALGRVDLGFRIANQLGRSLKVSSHFRMPEWDLYFSPLRNQATGVETVHRYFLSDPRAWLERLSNTPQVRVYRLERSFGWWYYGDGIPFHSETLNGEATAHPILADIHLEDPGQLTVRVFSPRVFKEFEPILRKMAPPGQVLPKPVAEVEELGIGLPVYQTHPECRGYLVLAANSDRVLTPEETRAVDEEWLALLMQETRYRWAGGKTLAELASSGQGKVVEDFLNQIDYMSASTTYYRAVLAALRKKLLD